MEETEPTPKRRLLPRTWRGYLVLGLCTLISLATIAWMLSRLTPPWHRPLDPDRADVGVLFDNAQNKLILDFKNMAERIPLGAQTWSISQDEINAYLAITFAPPLDGEQHRVSPEHPPAISEPMVTFSDGKVTLSARSPKIPGPNPLGGVGSVTFTVEIITGPDGKPEGLVKLSSVWVGDLPVPKSLIQSRFETFVPQLSQAITDAIATRLNNQELTKALPEIEDVTQAVAHGSAFPLEYTINRKHFVIQALSATGGQFSITLAPPPATGAGATPIATSPPPR